MVSIFPTPIPSAASSQLKNSKRNQTSHAQKIKLLLLGGENINSFLEEKRKPDNRREFQIPKKVKHHCFRPVECKLEERVGCVDSEEDRGHVGDR